MGSFGISYVLKTIVSLIVIIIAINFLLKKMETLSQKTGKHMRVVERMPLSRTSSLCVVEVCGTYYLMSCTEQHNDILQELDPSEWESTFSKVSPDEDRMTGMRKLFTDQTSRLIKKEARKKNW